MHMDNVALRKLPPDISKQTHGQEQPVMIGEVVREVGRREKKFAVMELHSPEYRGAGAAGSRGVDRTRSRARRFG